MPKIKNLIAALSTVALLALPAIYFSPAEGKEIKGSPIDHAVVHEGSITKEQPIRVRRFESANADVGKTGKKKYAHVATMMKQTAPESLMTAFIDGLKANGFKDVSELAEDSELPENSIVVEGEFTVLNPGSRAKRYWAGFGAGKSRICIEGRALGGEDAVLLEFDHCRFGAMGIFGGDAAKQMTTDAMRTGTRLSEFFRNWAVGAYAD
jgi:hypothetical protein